MISKENTIYKKNSNFVLWNRCWFITVKSRRLDSDLWVSRWHQARQRSSVQVNINSIIGAACITYSLIFQQAQAVSLSGSLNKSAPYCDPTCTWRSLYSCESHRLCTDNSSVEGLYYLLYNTTICDICSFICYLLWTWIIIRFTSSTQFWQLHSHPRLKSFANNVKICMMLKDTMRWYFSSVLCHVFISVQIVV